MNLVLIVSDTFRWDYLGCYGNEWIETPNLDALAKESVLFEDAFAEGLPTLPARRVILTGRRIIPFSYHYQHSDKVNLTGWHPLFLQDVTLSEVLLEQGYATCFVTDVYHMMKPNKNFHRGFEYWYWVRGVEDDRFNWRDVNAIKEIWEKATSWGNRPDDPRHWLVQHLNGRAQWQSDKDSLVGRVMTKAADWVRDYAFDYPFFLWADCFDPHEPWDPLPEYARKYDPDYDEFKYVFPPGSNKNMSEEEFRGVKAAYAGEVTMVDKWIGHLLDALSDRDLMDDTLIIFTSDHGCMMGEQGEIHKGADRLRNQVTQVPLLIRHPEGEAAGTRIGGFVQHQDIMPTALELLGVEAPERVNGESLWPLAAQGRDSDREQMITAFGFHASVRDKKWDYIAPWTEPPERHGRRTELYDLEDDPQELRNVIEEHPEVAEEMQAWLEQYIEEHRAETSGDLGPGVQGPPHDQAYV
jgi:arylsulfatase A-like enzyme